MNVFKYRVLLDGEERIFRDIEMPDTATCEQFHQTILNAFNFKGNEMASFFESNNEWDKGDEIPLVDMGLAETALTPMSELSLMEIAGTKGSRLIYVYDFLNLWIFFIELLTISSAIPDKKYPQIVAELGEAPNQNSRNIAKELELLESGKNDAIVEPEEDYDFENEEDFESLDDYEDMI